MGKSKTGLVATTLTAIGFIFVLIAFTTPNWLENDGNMKDPKFIKTGLWLICFNNFTDYYYHYLTMFNKCWWVFEEEYYIIHDIVLPPFFVATQFFFTLCFTLLLVGGFLTALYTCCSRHHQRYQELLWAVGANLILSGFCGIISVIIFGIHGDSRVWMPHWQHNHIGWSFALAVVGSFLILAAGILFSVEGKRFRKKLERNLSDEPKTQTTI